jgi:membrane-bound lytic murein transglycosylase D
MRLKIILSSLLVIAAASPSQAQQHGSATAGHAHVAKTDTTIIVKAKPDSRSANPVLASNTPTAKDGKKGYNHVPLAGEKSYFGDKNEYVNDFVRKYLDLHNKTLANVQNNSTQPFSVIDDILKQKNLPKELKYLAVIESALNHNAVSHAGAVGTWQLMATTAKMMGLSVTHRQDDRRDLYKSTAAATKYLELLYSQLNDWLLVIAAYNSGPVPVQRAIERTGSHNFWDIKEYLPRETQGHVLAFIATASIFENLNKFINLGSIPVDFQFGKEEEPVAVATAPLPPAKPGAANATPAAAAPGTMVAKKSPFTDEELKNMSIVRIKDPIDMNLLSQELGVDKKLLMRWNSDYELFTYNTYPTPFYNLRLPKDKSDLFLQKKELLTKKSKALFLTNK